MPRVQNSLELKGRPKADVTWLSPFTAMLQKLYQQLARTINGNLTFGDGTNPDNISVFYATVTPAVANVDFVLTHNLNRVPAGYLAVEKSAACDVYTGSVAPTATQITLRSSVNGVTLRIMVF